MLTLASVHVQIVHENKLLNDSLLVFIHNKEPRTDLLGCHKNDFV